MTDRQKFQIELENVQHHLQAKDEEMNRLLDANSALEEQLFQCQQQLKDAQQKQLQVPSTSKQSWKQWADNTEAPSKWSEAKSWSDDWGSRSSQSNAAASNSWSWDSSSSGWYGKD